MIKRLFITVFLLCSLKVTAQPLACPAGSVLTTNLLAGGGSTTVCSTVPPVGTAPTIPTFNASATAITLGQSVTFTWTVTGNPAPIVTLDLAGNTVTASGNSHIWTPPSTGDKMVTINASNGVLPNATPKSWTVKVNGTNPTEPIYPGAVTDPNVLGSCSEATHNAYLVSPGDGFRYWKWHPQNDPSGCIYAHEHGGNPTPVMNSIIAYFQGRTDMPAAYKTALLNYLNSPQMLLMGYATRRAPNHPPESHGGFKIFYVSYNECNEEGRCSLMLSIHMTHMGTGGVARFELGHHSVQSIQVHLPSGAFQVTPLMLNFGTPDMVCDPRQNPTRDFIVINTSRCKITSSYEIWSGNAEIREAGKMLFRAFATPAVFDPITVMNRAAPTEVVYAWDPRVTSQTRAFPTPSWDYFKGCDREAYAQPGIYEVSGYQMKWTDPFGVVVPESANALLSFFYSPTVTSNLRGSTPVGAEKEGNHAIKIRRPNCAFANSIKLLN